MWRQDEKNTGAERWPTDMRVMTARAPKVPRKTRVLDSFSASSTAMKKVLSPSSEKRINRKPDSTPSLKGEDNPLVRAAPVPNGLGAASVGRLYTLIVQKCEFQIGM